MIPFAMMLQRPVQQGRLRSEDCQCFRMARTTPKIAPSSWVICAHLIHGSMGPPDSSPKTACQSIQPFLHSAPWSVPLLYNGPLGSPQNCPFPFGDRVLHLYAVLSMRKKTPKIAPWDFVTPPEVKIAYVVWEICSWIDRQTKKNTHTDVLITILWHHSRG